MIKLGLVGRSLRHSFSKSFFDQLFESSNLDGEYLNYELSNLEHIRESLNHLNGFNVTIPYKEQILEYLDELSPEAEKIGAVNTVCIHDGKWKGYNTDVFGFQQSIKPFLRNIDERALILGTGGASKAVSFVLREIGIDVINVSRTPHGEKQFSYEEINGIMLNACKLIVNTTPVGMYPNSNGVIPFPYEEIGQDHLVVDLIYNPSKTEFLRLSEQQGATILNGESMLKHQALKSWEIWNNV